jgi:hypothetical protein
MKIGIRTVLNTPLLEGRTPPPLAAGITSLPHARLSSSNPRVLAIILVVTLFILVVIIGALVVHFLQKGNLILPLIFHIPHIFIIFPGVFAN